MSKKELELMLAANTEILQRIFEATSNAPYHKRNQYSSTSRERYNYNDEKKFGSSTRTSSYNSTPTLHRYYYPERDSTYHHHDHSAHRGASSRSSAGNSLTQDAKHYYERTSSRRRVAPPPLTPPLVPLTRTHHHHAPSSSSSRYRQAPPEDHGPINYRDESGLRDSRRGRRDVEERNLLHKDSLSGKSRKRVTEVLEEASTEKRKRKESRENEASEGTTTAEDKGGRDHKEEDDQMKKDDPETQSHQKVEHEKSEVVDNTNYNKTLLKLYCPYCDSRCVTLKEFVYHVRSYQHQRALSTAVGNMKKKVGNLRLAQKEEQKDLEKSEDGKKDLTDTSSFCRVCELDFRTDPKLHEKQDVHNELKALVDRECEVCDIQFRFWKVYMHHIVALEHVKRVALKEVREKEVKGECVVKGTNLSEEDLGMNLMEQRTVYYCSACVRYLPIRDSEEETKMRHCTSLTHVKLVEEYRQRAKRSEKRNVEHERSLEKQSTRTVDCAEHIDENSIKVEIAEDSQSNESDQKVRDIKEEVDEDEIQLHAEEDESVGVASNG